MGAGEDPSGVEVTQAGVASGAAVAAEVFHVIADRLAERIDEIALFTETSSSYEDWCTWEGVAACRRAGWPVEPRPAYDTVGVTGSREHAGLAVLVPASGCRVLVELSVIHDWTRNKWIANLDADTEKLRRPMTPGIVPLQIVLTASLDSPIEVNPLWRQWLGMSRAWKIPTDLRREMPLGANGQLLVHGWVLADEP